MGAVASERRGVARQVLAKRVLERRLARRDPLYLVSHMVGVDQRDGTRFTFEHLREPLQPGEVTLKGNTLVPAAKSWRWQRWFAERVLADRRLVVLKGRQIGVTWVVLACDVAEALLMPGTASLLYRQREEDAVDNIRRWWTLYQSLPAHFKEGIRVLQPDLGRTTRPGREGVSLLFPSGEVSEIVPMTSAQSSGHGRTIRRALLDEAGHIEKLAHIRAAVEPAVGHAALDLVSTANGRSNQETGEGNEFHRLWELPDSGYTKIFLPYDVHPDRDAHWYETAPEVQSLPLHLRQQNFPRDEHEAFALSDRLYFDAEVLAEYRDRVRLPQYRFDFCAVTGELATTGEARVRKHDAGHIRLFEPPKPNRKYAIGADTATGRGADYSVAYVVDLAEMALVAEFIGRIDADLYAGQLHYLGKWYNAALIAPEDAGGWGEAVIISLRDGRAGRPPYRKLYRHIMSSRPTLDESKAYGFPVNQKTRPLILAQLAKAIRERHLPFVSDQLLHQMENFVHHDSGTTPRARDGSHDDCVMAAAIALEMYRLWGEHPDMPKRSPREAKTLYPWQTPRKGRRRKKQHPSTDDFVRRT